MREIIKHNNKLTTEMFTNYKLADLLQRHTLYLLNSVLGIVPSQEAGLAPVNFWKLIP